MIDDYSDNAVANNLAISFRDNAYEDGLFPTESFLIGLASAFKKGLATVPDR